MRRRLRRLLGGCLAKVIEFSLLFVVCKLNASLKTSERRVLTRHCRLQTHRKTWVTCAINFQGAATSPPVLNRLLDLKKKQKTFTVSLHPLDFLMVSAAADATKKRAMNFKQAQQRASLAPARGEPAWHGGNAEGEDAQRYER